MTPELAHILDWGTSCQLTGQTSAGSYDALAIKLTLGR